MRDPHIIAQAQDFNSTEKDLKATLHILRQLTFWSNLDFMLEILKPIHLQQKKSESNTHHLGAVLQSWSRIKNNWKRLLERFPEQLHVEAISDDIIRYLKERCIKQTTDIH